MVLQPQALLLGSPGLGCSEFARHYFRNHGCFLFLQVLRWFTSLGLLHAAMYSLHDDRCSHRPGFPIRKSPDHSVLATPRGLSQLATSFIAFLRQGIHTHALSSLTIKFTLNTDVSRRFVPPPLPTMATCSCPSIFNCQRSRQLATRSPQAVSYGLLRIPRQPIADELLSGSAWWAWVESNYRPHPYQGCALAT